MKCSTIVLLPVCLLINTAVGTDEIKYTIHGNVSVGRSMNASVCDIFALTPNDRKYKIFSDGCYIDPSCSIYLVGVENIENSYRFSGTCFKVTDISLACGGNETIIIRGWNVNIIHQNQSLSMYTNQSMLVTEATFGCHKQIDFTQSYEFCWENISMLEISFHSLNMHSVVLPALIVHTRVFDGPTYRRLSLHSMDTMTLILDDCKSDIRNWDSCKSTTHLINNIFINIDQNGNIDNKNNKEGTNILNYIIPVLCALITAIAIVVAAVISIKKCAKKPEDNNGNATQELMPIENESLKPENKVEVTHGLMPSNDRRRKSAVTRL
ncbi:uncharacterized protein LOC134681689 [Mytilus trossulus]|uniref:uncharacterized protein LOC134681689 n=1 Tax=Mytilus trossulus TaxID=6551 RepID=UPI003007846D